MSIMSCRLYTKSARHEQKNADKTTYTRKLRAAALSRAAMFCLLSSFDRRRILRQELGLKSDADKVEFLLNSVIVEQLQ
ncbi:hypothetical protein ABVT39_006709 [Epinephelus coioides]